MTLSYLEIYNENIRDLLNPSSGNLELRDQDAHGKNIHVAGLSEVATNSTEEGYYLNIARINNVWESSAEHGCVYQ